MKKRCGNAYDAASQNQGWQWWLLLPLYVWECIERGDAAWLGVRAWEQGIINLSQEKSEEYYRPEIRLVGCAFTVMRLIQNNITSDLDFKELKGLYIWQGLKSPI